MMLRNAPSHEYVATATVERIGTYVYGLLLLSLEGVVWGTGVALTYPKEFVSPEVSAKYAKKNRQKPRTESIMGCVHLKMLIGNAKLRKQVSV